MKEIQDLIDWVGENHDKRSSEYLVFKKWAFDKMKEERLIEWIKKNPKEILSHVLNKSKKEKEIDYLAERKYILLAINDFCKSIENNKRIRLDSRQVRRLKQINDEHY